MTGEGATGFGGVGAVGVVDRGREGEDAEVGREKGKAEVNKGLVSTSPPAAALKFDLRMLSMEKARGLPPIDEGCEGWCRGDEEEVVGW